MGHKVLLIALFWLFLLAKESEQKVGNSSLVKDSYSAESVNYYEPFGIYASGVPYGSFALHNPVKITLNPVTLDSVNSESHLVPVNEESFVIRTQNGALKDSYGNTFVESPRTLAYKTTFPQQFVRLQDLPLHLSQPLVAQPGFAFNRQQFGSIRSSGAAAPLIRYNSPHPLVYAGDVKSVTPVSGRYSVPRSPQQQPSNSKAVYTNKQPSGYYPQKSQRVEGKPHPVQKSQPAKQVTVTTLNNNGKKTTLTLETKPPLPLINLNLLKPLSFSNPVVTQVQHFLPKINYDLPKVESHKHHDEFVVQKTKSYNTGILPDDPQSDDSDEESAEHDTQNPPRNPSQQDKSQDHHHNLNPSVTVNGNRGGPDYSYKINSPNYKEHYNEKAVNYDKKKDYKPVHYTYSEQFDKKPVSYSYTKSSKEPVKSVHYETHNRGPKQLIYNLKPESDSPRGNPSSHSAENESGESDQSGESSPEHYSHYEDQHVERPNSYPPKPSSGNEKYNHELKLHVSHGYHNKGHTKPSYELRAEHRESDHDGRHNHKVYNNPNNIIYGKPRQHNSQPIRVPVQLSKTQSINPHQYEENIRFVPVYQQNSPIQVSQKQQPQTRLVYNLNGQELHQYHPQIQIQPQNNGQVIHHHQSLTPAPQHHEFVPAQTPQQNQYHHLAASPQMNSQQAHHFNPPQTHNQPHHIYHNSAQQRRPPQQFQENHAPIQSRPQQHYSAPQEHQNYGTSSQHHPHHHEDTPHPPSQHNSQPHIIEKSRKIIIQEETPDEMHSHREQMVAEMIEQDDNNEDDFEKAYKEAAYGFPGYNRDPDQVEKDIYDPDSYGIPKNAEYNIDDSPFEQFHKDGDEYPKQARITYKDDINNMKEDYYLDYSLSQPESLLDRHKSKVNYYKTFKQQKPKFYFSDEPQKKNKKTEKYSVDPFDYQQKSQDFFAAYKEAPKYEYDYSKESSRDNSAFPSGVIRTSKTLFVEPQFQYGFEPISLPTLLDGELAAMATNDSPGKEKAGTRKKIYQENWYIKKTSVGDGS